MNDRPTDAHAQIILLLNTNVLKNHFTLKTGGSWRKISSKQLNRVGTFLLTDLSLTKFVFLLQILRSRELRNPKPETNFNLLKTKSSANKIFTPPTKTTHFYILYINSTNTC
jgi:hypothetical protein